MASQGKYSSRRFWQQLLPKIVIAPSFALILFFVYGFIAWTAYISLSRSRMLPNYNLDGIRPYEKLWNSLNWQVALENLAVFGILYIVICCVLGLFLAILLDQKIRFEGGLRPVFLYPMALSFIVTGTAWKWFLNPGLGLEKTMHELGWESFSFDWLINPEMAIYTVVIAGVWQTSGFVMAMFLAGLRGIDSEMLKAAQLDGASSFQMYRRIIIPQLRPVFLSAFIVLAHMAIKSYDLVIALTGGGPGNATELPATFMYSYTFSRNQMAVGSASAIVMLMTIAAIIVPYLYSELKEPKHGEH
ncbi:sugar ABC transporter permease [Grimontia hollisae]|uniref:ABC-type sugar transport system permease component n=2 Tax=Grimontia hollisae TaxID=673 RepID=D0I4H1_GRIHO|nr:sugar ABC transporter permease [Grimontia hollisae]AMG30103.1 sugar ABC transporter permease [Grimontia hollisae]EEY73388.1 ABC-type sugar transport system permease component [Grimontia hollisae CIP 101886]MDF2184496.1 sugar ABC transporter permease [Grimontia hollisae]STO42692.1 sn-glycerol-3-phosphate transport system permease protein ugpA [Grimontia hollisae]STO56541.1 sn-glycerol-3-phosphate transport system permease protein ugpA [Grimontia hollisae]